MAHRASRLATVVLPDPGTLARMEQDARWRADEQRLRAKIKPGVSTHDRIMFWLVFGIPGFCILTAVLAAALTWFLAAIGLVPLLILILLALHQPIALLLLIRRPEPRSWPA